MTDLPKNISSEKRALLQKVVNELTGISRLKAVVLGGSYASGTAHSGSDLDIGLYYEDAEPFDIDAVKNVAQKIAAAGSTPVVTGFYEWGVWVNGGAWIQTNVCKVDFLYRSLDQVEKVIAEARQGIWRHDYDQQPTFGYYNTGYLEETRICLPLFDPEQRIARLKEAAAVYPALLRATILKDSLWSAEFTLSHAKGFAEKGDVYNTSGCMGRVASSLTQTLFALNEHYFLTDKKVMETICGFAQRPVDYCQRLQLLLSYPGAEKDELTSSVELLEGLWQEVKELAGGEYKAKY
jgi:predicted nucleotidyltransferase